MKKNIDEFFGKLKSCESSSLEFGNFVEEFSKKRNGELKEFMTDRINGNNEKTADNTPLYHTPCEVLYSEGSFRILKYNGSPTHEEPLLLIPSLINRYYILDLMEDVSFVKYLKENGVNVYLLDWGVPGPEQDHLELDTYIFKWIDRAVNKVLRDSGKKDLTLMGYCMGATIAAVYAAAYPEKINGFISLAAPYDFDNDDPLSLMAKSLDVDKMLEAYDGMAPEMLQVGFMLAQPTSSYFKMKSLYSNGSNEKRNTTFLHLERWLSDNIPFPKEAYREYIKKFYQNNDLYRDNLEIGGVAVSLSDMTMPVLNVIAEKDNIVPKPAALALNEKAGSERKDLYEVKAGHIGVIMGRKAREAWENMLEWFRDINNIKK